MESVDFCVPEPDLQPDGFALKPLTDLRRQPRSNDHPSWTHPTASGEKGKYPEFKGNVKTVETRDFWRDAEVSPRNQGFHYNQNAETYMLVGEALGKGMIELLEK